MNYTARERSLWSAGIAVVVVVSLVPVLWIVSLSLKDPSTLGDGRFLPAKWSLKNYKGIFKQSIFTDALRNSIGIAIIATIMVACLMVFVAAGRIERLIGVTGNIVLSRLLGVLLAALAVQFVVDGVRVLIAG